MKKNKAKERAAAALERFKQELAACDYFEKVDRDRKSWEFLQSHREDENASDQWHRAYRDVQACNRNRLVFEAVAAGAYRAQVAKVLGMSGVSHIIDKSIVRNWYKQGRPLPSSWIKEPCCILGCNMTQ